MSNGFYLFIAISSLVAVIITSLLGIFFRKNKIIKYIPAMVSGIAAVGFYIKSQYFSTGMEDLGYIVMALISAIVFAISLINAFIIDLLQRNRV